MTSRKGHLVALLLVTVVLFGSSFQSNGQEDPGISEVEVSLGLPQETDSFTTVERFDSDHDGRDEIFLGGAGFTDNVMTEGIRSFEFNEDTSRWTPFGTGLPGEGDGLYFGALGLGDVNGDGEMDIAGPVPTRWFLSNDEGDAGVYLYSGDGHGNFEFLYMISLTDPLGQPYHDSSNEVEIVDLDDDGYNDVVVTTYIGIRIFYGDGSGTNWEEQSPVHPTQTEISGVGIGDLNNDGRLDLVGTPYQRSTTIEMYIQESGRVFRSRDFKETSAGYGIKIADLDNDGNNDIVYGTNSEGIKVWLGEGRTTLTTFPCTEASSGLPTGGGAWNQVELGDVNGDGRLDLISACSSFNTVNLFINDLPSGWSEVFADQLYVMGDPYGANFGDWDGDGSLDIAGCGWDNGVNAWLIEMEGSGIPIADAGDDITAYLGDPIRLDGRESRDYDGDIVEWSWTCTSHGDVILQNADTSRPTFLPDEEGEYTFQLTVKDDDGQWSGPSIVEVTVLDPQVNYPPIADAGVEQAVELGDDVHLDGSRSSDIDGTIVDYIWSCSSHTVTFNDQGEPDAWFTPDRTGDYTILLVVVDEDGASSDPDTVTIHVEEGLIYPTLGPFLYEDGKPITAAKVYLEEGGYLFMAETDDEGEAYFRFGIPPGTYNCRVVKDGKLLLDDISVSMDYKGTVTIETGELPSAPLEESVDMAFWPMVAVVLVIVIVVIVIMIFILMRGKGREVETVEVAYVQEKGGCPECGGQLNYMQDFGRYFCPACNKYF